MVIPIMKVHQGLLKREFITTRPNPAIATIRMKRIAMRAAPPVIGPTSSFAIYARDLPSLLMEAARIMKSWTPPARAAPTRIHRKPGR